MWYVLNYIAHPNTKASMVVERFNERNNTTLELFAPTFVTMVEREGVRIPREKPLTYHYVFLQGEESEVKKLCSEPNGFSLALSHTDSGRYLTVSDAGMTAFKAVASTLGNRLPCFNPKDIPLEEGDEVEIVAGQFPGLRGTYIPKRGGRSGNLYVSVAHNFATVLYDVKADYIRVLRFAATTKRPYDQLEAFLPRLYKAKEKQAAGEQLTSKDIAPIIIFCRRMEDVEMPNPKFNARLRAALIAGNRLLGNKAGEEKAQQIFDQVKAQITNLRTQEEVERLLG